MVEWMHDSGSPPEGAGDGWEVVEVDAGVGGGPSDRGLSRPGGLLASPATAGFVESISSSPRWRLKAAKSRMKQEDT